MIKPALFYHLKLHKRCTKSASAQTVSLLMKETLFLFFCFLLLLLLVFFITARLVAQKAGSVLC